MRVLKVGPGFGHNIEQFIRFFNGSPEVELTFVFTGKDGFSYSYPNVEFVPLLSFSLLRVLWRVVKGKFDVVWMHGGNRLVFGLAFFCCLMRFKKNRPLFVLNVWGEKLIRKLEGSGMKARLYCYALCRLDLVQFNWYELEDLARSYLPTTVKTKTLLWGIPELFFNAAVSERRRVEVDKAVSYDGYKFFFPKSFTSQSGHSLLVDAARLLKDEKAPFKIYILEGNGRSEKEYVSFQKKIREQGLSEYFVFLEFTSYLSPSEMAYLWGKMDCGLQIVYGDQLSNTFVEPQACGLPIVASNIKQYRRFNEVFDVAVELANNDEFSVCAAMLKQIRGGTSECEILKRQQAVLRDYVFENNCRRILDFYKKLRVE